MQIAVQKLIQTQASLFVEHRLNINPYRSSSDENCNGK